MSDMPAAGGPELDRMLEHLRRGPARLGRARLLTVDGPSGSGKSTVARQAAEATGAALVPVDHLLDGWHGGIDRAVQALVAHVLEPLTHGRPGRYRRYDWHQGRFGEQVEVSPAPVLVVEGVGAGAQALDPYRTTSVWLDAPTDLRRTRALARDGDSFDGHWDHWAGLERDHFAREETASRADLCFVMGATSSSDE